MVQVAGPALVGIETIRAALTERAPSPTDPPFHSDGNPSQ